MKSSEPLFPSPALSGAGSMGMISARLFRAPLLDFDATKVENLLNMKPCLFTARKLQHFEFTPTKRIQPLQAD